MGIAGCARRIKSCLLHIAQVIGVMHVAREITLVVSNAEEPRVSQWHRGLRQIGGPWSEGQVSQLPGCHIGCDQDWVPNGRKGWGIAEIQALEFGYGQPVMEGSRQDIDPLGNAVLAYNLSAQ